MPDTTEVMSPATAAFLRGFRAVVLLGLVAALGWVVWHNATAEDAKRPFKLGLDLAGGSHLVYEADVSGVDPAEVPGLMATLRDVIERRINIFGVSEPIVQVERSSFAADVPVERLVVELPGVTDVAEAVAEIGRTPLLEFKLYDETIAAQLDAIAGLTEQGTSSDIEISNIVANDETLPESPYVDTGLTGRYLESARFEQLGGTIDQVRSEPVVSIRFNNEGAQLFADITRANVGQPLAIFLDGELISAPNINEPIVGGTAIISGGFTIEEARGLAQNLSFGALPVPITLESTQTVGASLGAEVLEKGVWAGVIGLGAVVFFLIAWYRLPGLLAGVALISYVVVMMALFQYIPVTLTAAGLAGFVLSIGMAVDANVLVFERMQEEWRSGKSSRAAAQEGFARAWSAIRDGNITSLLSAIILFWFGTSMVKGFALVFGVGVIVSMLSAILITRTLLIALPDVTAADARRWGVLFGSGCKK
jgi:protein-export membrane protein SecD